MGAPLTLMCLRKLLQEQILQKNFHTVLSHIDLKTAGDGQCVAEMTVSQPHLNLAGTLHGGLSATLIDCISTFALLTRKNVRSASIDLNVSFLGPAKEGDLVTINAKTLKTGQTLAYLSVDILREGKLIVTGRQTKFLQQDIDHFGNKIAL